MKKRPKLKGFTESVEDYYAAAKDSRILRLGIQIDTPPCNWECPYCYAGEETVRNKSDSVPVEVLLSWIDQGVDLGATGLTVNGTFEPTMGKDIFTVLSHSSKKGLNTLIVTNGSGLTRDSVRILKELNISILIKLNVPISREGDRNFEEYGKIQAYLSGKNNSSMIYNQILRKLDMLKNEGFNIPIEQGDEL